MSRNIIKDLIDHVTTECTPIDVDERYRDMIRECYDFTAVGGPFTSMDPAAVLEEQDPTAYRCGCNDYVDGEGWIELCGENYESKDVDNAAEEFIDDLESELSDLEEELEELPEDEESDERDELQMQIDELNAEVDACRKHTF